MQLRSLPNMLFYGPPGTGKTTVANLLVENRGDGLCQGNVLRLNASDERGVVSVRRVVAEFTTCKSIGRETEKVVILDEADFMTAQAHIHLYNLIKSSPSNVTFIIICNFLFCMDEQLRNCLVRIKFSAPPKKTIAAYTRRIMKSENVENTIPIEKIVDVYYPDIRSIINVCQRQCKMPMSPPFTGQCMLSRQAAQLGTSKLNVAKVTIEQMLRDTKDNEAALSLANKYCIFATLSATNRRLACDYFLTSIIPSM